MLRFLELRPLYVILRDSKLIEYTVQNGYQRKCTGQARRNSVCFTSCLGTAWFYLFSSYLCKQTGLIRVEAQKKYEFKTPAMGQHGKVRSTIPHIVDFGEGLRLSLFIYIYIYIYMVYVCALYICLQKYLFSLMNYL